MANDVPACINPSELKQDDLYTAVLQSITLSPKEKHLLPEVILPPILKFTSKKSHMCAVSFNKPFHPNLNFSILCLPLEISNPVSLGIIF
jgi:hypothetical protein